MKGVVPFLLVLLTCVVSHGGPGQDQPLTADQRDEVARNLASYERGLLSFQQLRQKDICEELVAYYQEMHGSVSTKAKLPISSCMERNGKFSLALQLAGEYLQVYSNDWRGWTVAGTSMAELGHTNHAIRAYARAVSLGGISVCEALGGIAFSAGRMDVVGEVVPGLLKLKSEQLYRADVLTILLSYSMETNNDSIFLEAISGVKPAEVVADWVLREDIRRCDLFFRLSLPAEKACWKLNSQVEKLQTSLRNQRGEVPAPSRSSRAVALQTLTTSPAAAGTGDSGRFVTSLSLPAKEFGFLEATQMYLTIRWYVPPPGWTTNETFAPKQDWQEWREAAGTSLSHGDTNGALRALDQAVAAGDMESCQALAGLSFASGQFERVGKLVSKLLARMSAKNTSEQERLCVASILLCYSALIENAGLHARIVNRVEPAELGQNPWLASDMMAGLRLFAASWKVEKSILVLNQKVQKWKVAHQKPRPRTSSPLIL